MFKTFVVAAALAAPVLAPELASAQAPRGKAAKAGAIAAADIAALNGADVEAAARVAETLGASASPASHDALLDALAMGLPAAVAVPAIVSLAKHPAPPDVAALIRYANHTAPSVRSAAITALAAYPAPPAQKLIVERIGDQVASVRAVAAAAAAKGKLKVAVDPLLVLLARGELPAGDALAAMADATLAAKIADQLGKMPAEALAHTLGKILLRSDVADPMRVEVVRAIGKIDDRSAVTALQDYLANSPKTPVRPSRGEAQMIVDARLGGGK